MIELSRYELEALREDHEFVLYRGRKNAELPSILVLLPVSEFPPLESLERLKHEYSLKDELGPDWAARPIEIARHRERPGLVLEVPGGVCAERLVRQPLDVAFSLRLAISLSTAIGHMHQRGIVHKDIKPANALVNSVTGRCWLSGVCIASPLPREPLSSGPPQFVAGTLAYMAPEQT